MHQFFLQWILDAEKLVRRFPKADWANLAGASFWTHHREILDTDPLRYRTLWEEARDEVQRRLFVTMSDYKE